MRWALAVIFLCVAAALARFALLADEPWFVRHVLTLDYYEPPSRLLPLLVRGGAVLSAALCLAAAVLVLRRPPSLGALLRVALAVVLALVAGEGILRYAERHKSEERRTLHTRLGQRHPRYGWTMRPGLAATVRLAGRDLDLAFDAQGNRVRSLRELPDAAAPSLLIAGESVASGHDLQWDETFAARAAAALSLQPISLAVNGYGVDQAALRLLDALPLYAHPDAVVLVVMPVQLGRNLIDNHPRLALQADGSLALQADGSLALLPEAAGFWADLRLRRLLWQQLPYRSDAAIARTVALSRALLQKVAAAARARGARPLFLLPDAAGWVTEALFSGTDLPHVEVRLESGERFANDWHPNPRGAERLAAAVVQALRR